MICWFECQKCRKKYLNSQDALQCENEYPPYLEYPLNRRYLVHNRIDFYAIDFDPMPSSLDEVGHIWHLLGYVNNNYTQRVTVPVSECILNDKSLAKRY